MPCDRRPLPKCRVITPSSKDSFVSSQLTAATPKPNVSTPPYLARLQAKIASYTEFPTEPKHFERLDKYRLKLIRYLTTALLADYSHGIALTKCEELVATMTGGDRWWASKSFLYEILRAQVPCRITRELVVAGRYDFSNSRLAYKIAGPDDRDQRLVDFDQLIVDYMEYHELRTIPLKKLQTILERKKWNTLGRGTYIFDHCQEKNEEKVLKLVDGLVRDAKHLFDECSETMEGLPYDQFWEMVIESTNGQLKVGYLVNPETVEKHICLREQDLYNHMVTTETLFDTDYSDFIREKNLLHANIASIKSLTDCWIQINDVYHKKIDPITELQDLGHELDRAYTKIFKSELWKGIFVVPLHYFSDPGYEFPCVIAKDEYGKAGSDSSSDGSLVTRFYRAVVKAVFFDTEEAKVQCVDYGFVCRVPWNEVYFMQKKFQQSSKKSLCARIQLKNCELSENGELAAVDYIRAMTAGIRTELQVSEATGELIIEEISIRTKQHKIKISDILIQKQVALPCKPTSILKNGKASSGYFSK